MDVQDRQEPTTGEQLVLDMIRAVEDRDMEALVACYHPDVEFVWPPDLPYGGTHRGRDVLTMTDTFATLWGPRQQTAELRRLDPRLLGSIGNQVAVHYTQRGRDEGGQLHEMPVIGLYTVVDGLVRRLQMFYFDPVSTAAFLGSRAGDDAD